MIASLASALRPESFGQWMRLTSVLALVPMVLLCLWIWLGLSRPSAVLVLEGFQMVLLAPSWVILAGALWGRQWAIAAVAAFVVASHLAFSLPAATADDVPGWVQDAPTFTMYSANVLYQNAQHDALVRDVLERDADVVVINEMTDALYEAFEAQGVFEQYPTVSYWRSRPFGELLMTRLDVVESSVENIGGMGVPWALVDVDGVEAKVFAPHVTAPKSSADRHIWRRNLHGLATVTERRAGRPTVFVGDFNSTLWHGPFRDLLDAGLTDGHDQQGQGLERTWTSPVVPLRWLGPIMGLDHVLVNDAAFVTEIKTVTTPGSDHRGLLTTIAIRRPSDG